MKKHTRSKTGRRRSHQALKPSQLFPCPNCGHPVLAHRYCPSCGNYKGRIVREPRLKIKK